MPTSVTQKKFAGSSSQKGFTGTVTASTIGTIIPEPEIAGAILTQSGGYLLTQSGDYLIIQ